MKVWSNNVGEGPVFIAAEDRTCGKCRQMSPPPAAWTLEPWERKLIDFFHKLGRDGFDMNFYLFFKYIIYVDFPFGIVFFFNAPADYGTSANCTPK